MVPATDDRDVALVWYQALLEQGIEGLVVKPLTSRYITSHREWTKIRRRDTTGAWGLMVYHVREFHSSMPLTCSFLGLARLIPSSSKVRVTPPAGGVTRGFRQGVSCHEHVRIGRGVDK